MRIVVFGAGAVGGHLAARLGAHGAKAGIEVAAVARGGQLAAIAERGVTLWIGEERTFARIRVTDRPESLGRQDVVLVTLKSSVLPAAAAQLASLGGPDTVYVFAMNGIPWWYLYKLGPTGIDRPDLSLLDPGGALAGAVGLERVVGCMINSANTVVEPAVIRNSPGTKNRFTLGEPDGTMSSRLRQIAEALEAAAIPAPLTGTIRAEIWDKLLRNLGTSPICALSGEPIGVLAHHPELFALSKNLMREGLATCRAHGVELDFDIARDYRMPPNTTHKSSMLQDFEHGRPPEIDGILTAVQSFARAAGVATPHVDAVTALVIEKARRMGLYPAA